MRALAPSLMLLLAALLLVACSHAQPVPIGAGEHEFQLVHDGRGRFYRVRVPTAVARGEPLPVLLAFHGGGGNPSHFQRLSGIDAAAEREGFVAVYPAGSGRLQRQLLTWNAGDGCCGFARDQGVDDVGFVLALIDDLSARLSLDRDRIYATGHSNGAGMVYRLASEAPGLLAAIAPVAGASMGVDRSQARAIPLLHIHSIDDPRALYHGGITLPFPGADQTHEHGPVPEELAFWATLNGCGTEPAVSDRRQTTEGDQLAEHLAWPCPPSTPVTHWRLQGVGHGWPGAQDQRREPAGPTTDLISATDELWPFLSQFRRPND